MLFVVDPMFFSFALLRKGYPQKASDAYGMDKGIEIVGVCILMSPAPILWPLYICSIGGKATHIKSSFAY